MLLAGMVAIGLSGCWAAIAELAADVASDTAQVAGGVVESVHHESSHVKDDNRPGESEADRMERCNSLALQAPDVIELRKSTAGAPEYRELSLHGSFDDAKWTPITDNDTDATGWRPATNFLKMNFNPPLAGALPETGTNYLAYAPKEAVSTADQDRVAALTMNFGGVAGTFDSDGKVFQFATSPNLPCFALSPP